MISISYLKIQTHATLHFQRTHIADTKQGKLNYLGVLVIG